MPSELVSAQPSAAASGTIAGRRGLEAVAWPPALYLALSIVLFGLPVIGHLSSHIIAYDPGDPSVYMFFFAWWPHALLHGLNPFITHAILYPQGYNLEWAASSPLLSIVLAPITLAFSPAVSWNVFELLAPALGAWTAYLLCRRIVGRTLPALVGGYVFGFSPYVLSELQAHPNLSFVAIVPLFVLLVLKRIDTSLTPRRFVVWMTLAIAAQYLIGSEVLVGSALFGAFALVLAYLLLPGYREALREVVKLLAIAVVCSAVLLSPFLYYFLFGPSYPPIATAYEADLASFVLPPVGAALQLHGGVPFLGSDLETYIGLPLLVLIGAFVWQRRRERRAVLLVLCAVAAELLALGSTLLVRGDITSVSLPWRLLKHLPLLRYAIPLRFALFAMLPIAVIVAIWLGDDPVPWRVERRGALRWGLVALAIAFIVPAVGASEFNTPIHDPPFFARHEYRRYLTSSDHVMTIPFWGPNQRWIADAGFPFALSAGSGGQGQNPAYSRYRIWASMQQYPYTLPTDYGAALRTFLKAKDVTAIVVEQGFPGPWHKLFGTLGIKPIVTGGVLLYRLRSA
jgi:hypothetical protein